MANQAQPAPAGAPAATVDVNERFPDYRRSVALKYVKRGFTMLCSHALTILLVPLTGFLVLELLNLYQNGELLRLWTVASQTDLTVNLVAFVGCVALLAGAIISFLLLQSKPVYLLDFAVYRAPETWAATYPRFMAGSRGCGAFTEESLEFQEKILSRSGVGQNTYLPPVDTMLRHVPVLDDNGVPVVDADGNAAVQVLPPCPSMAKAREEFEMVVFSAVREALDKTGIKPKQIGILVINCSLFNPTPSLAAMVINHFKMRSNIYSYCLGGMGCSASPISIDLAKQLLQLHNNTYALVISTENITQNWYFGNERAMLMPNCLFRVGGAAIIMTNKRSERRRSKYELLHTVRTHLGAKDEAYSCIYQMEDDQGKTGVRLTKELMAVAGEALKVNITTLGPLVLPISEQLIFLVNLVLRKVFNRKLKPYIPDFKLAFDHVCIHTGGRAVIDEIEKQLRLKPDMVEPSRATLYRYGNTSSSSVWYVLAYIEQFRGVRRGDRIWQMGFGSGFKCNSAVWKAIKRVEDKYFAWEGFDHQEMRDVLAALPNHNRGRK